MNCAHTYAHIWIIHLHHTMTPWISVTFFEFEDLMTTCSDEDVPALDNIGY